MDNGIRLAAIFSVSRSILQACQKYNFNPSTSYLIFKIRNLLYIAHTNNLSITLVWIPGHKGIIGNEIADNLARLAVNEGSLVNMKLPHTDIWDTHFSSSLKASANKWMRTSTVENKGVYFFQNFFCLPQPNKPWFNKSKWDRRTIITISRLRSNHHNLASSLARKSFVQGEDCSFCVFEVQDINRVVWTCPKFADSRKRMEASLMQHESFPPFSIEPFLYQPNSRGLSIILKFLISNELYI